jgi:hypothetical protein
MGGFIYHDMGLQFLTPTINLKILPDDFIELVEHLEYYMQQPVQEAHIDGSPCPVGMIPQIGGAKICTSILSTIKLLRKEKRNGRSVQNE